MAMSKKQLEKKYGIKIVKDIDEYRIYTADGCLWENGLRTLKAVEKECHKWSGEIFEIKEKVGD